MSKSVLPMYSSRSFMVSGLTFKTLTYFKYIKNTQLVKNPPAMWETWVRSLGWEDPWRRKRLLTPVFWPVEFHELYRPGGHRVRHNWVIFTNIHGMRKKSSLILLHATFQFSHHNLLRNYFFPIAYSFFLGRRLTDQKSVNLFLRSLFYSTGLCVSFNNSTI